MRRRAFLIGGAGAGFTLPFLGAPGACAQPQGVPAGGEIVFKVLRKGAHIGEHSVKFDQDGETLTVRTEVRITVHVGPVPVYHHVQKCTEKWVSGRFSSLTSNTSSNAIARESIKAWRSAQGIYIEPAAGDPFTAPADCLPMTHWNRAIYQGAPSFNPQTGKLLKLTLVSRGDDMVRLADGTSVRAMRYSVKGDGVMDDFYDAQGVWTGLHTRVQDGSFVDYLRQSTPPEASKKGTAAGTRGGD